MIYRTYLKTFGASLCAALIVGLSLYAQSNGGTSRGVRPRGGGRGPVAVPVNNDEPVPKVPVGFTPIFNGQDLSGWHVSRTNHHGTTPDFHVAPGGILLGSQNPIGQGGVLLTDKTYKNV